MTSSDDGSEYEPVLYKDNYKWADIEPMEVSEWDGDGFCVKYTEEYKDLFGYFHAIMKKDEISERAVEISERVIEQVPSHYTAWWYKYHVLKKLGNIDFEKENQWINGILMENPKNYQLWFYKEWLFKRCDVVDQISFFEHMLNSDSKNFHLWSFAIFYGERWNKQAEIYQLALDEIKRDVRNNSAWNARYIVGQKLNVDVTKEFKEAAATLKEISQNEPVINFLIAMCEIDNSLIDDLLLLPDEMLKKKPDNFFAYYIKLYIETKRNNDLEIIRKICNELLIIDPIRAPYYNLLKSGKIHFKF